MLRRLRKWQAPFRFHIDYSCSCYLHGNAMFHTIVLKTQFSDELLINQGFMIFQNGGKNETDHNKTIQRIGGLR